MKKRIIAAICAGILLVLSGCAQSGGSTAGNEIALRIQLDVQENIGLLLVGYEAGTSSGSGGTSHADKSLIKHDELLFYTLGEQDFENPEDVENLSLNFTVITEYVDPNYENVYPAEYTKPAGEITLNARFGETYSITITGSRAGGYEAVLTEESAAPEATSTPSM